MFESVFFYETPHGLRQDLFYGKFYRLYGEINLIYYYYYPYLVILRPVELSWLVSITVSFVATFPRSFSDVCVQFFRLLPSTSEHYVTSLPNSSYLTVVPHRFSQSRIPTANWLLARRSSLLRDKANFSRHSNLIYRRRRGVQKNQNPEALGLCVSRCRRVLVERVLCTDSLECVTQRDRAEPSDTEHFPTYTLLHVNQ